MSTKQANVRTAAPTTAIAAAAQHSPAAARDRSDAQAQQDGVEDPPINILIVDDEPGNLVVLETVLDDPGYRLVRAQSADQALLSLVEEEFALLILDVRMPGMTGFELAQMIKERKKTAQVPIIFMTAYYDKDHHVLEGYGTGAVDYLNKPVDPAVLRSKVSVFADLHRKNRTILLANRALMNEVAERRRAEEKLQELNETLERRVTERTEALQQADAKLNVLLDSITDGLLTLDGNWCFSYINAQGAGLLGLNPEKILGCSVWDVLAHTAGTMFYEGFHRAVLTQQTVSFDAFYPEPLSRWFQCRCYPSKEGLSVYFHDITDRREVELRREQLLAAEQAARNEGDRIARTKDEFLTSLSHELRTPLAAIVGWTNVLKRADTDDKTVRRGIDAIARNAEVQARLVDDLLDMGRIVSGKLRMNIELVCLNAIATAAAETARPAAAAKNLRMDIRLADPKSVELMGDPSRLQQIATNLMTNALKFTPAGGSVTVSTMGTPAHVELTVTDTGQGIAADFLPHLFDRFSQADGSAARLHGGLGLGLSIVKHLVELHAGTVTVHSAGPGQGSSFQVRLPRLNAGQARAKSVLQDGVGLETDRPAESADSPHLDLRGVSVLLVDDHADLLEVERRILTEQGAAVTTALSGEQALQCLRTANFDALLSDLGMPGMDGYELIGQIRSGLGLSPQQLPAAAVTAYLRAEDCVLALRHGFQLCILKPVSPTALVRTVSDLVQLKSASSVVGPAPSVAAEASSTTSAPEATVANQGVNVAALPPLRALFIEDNPDLREGIGWQLEQAGLVLVTCASGEEGQIEYNKGVFDLVITDVSLPNMSGIDFANWILSQSPDAWVVFSTGYSMGNSLSKFGPNVRALLKPFEAEDLCRVISEVRTSIAARTTRPVNDDRPAV